jgi:hypothetical protein
MSFNGSGVFQRLYNWTNDAAANIKIRADRFDNEMDGMATGLSTCLTKDGQTTVTANLPMSTYRHTGVGNGSARNDYAALGQVQDGKLNWVAAGGTADAITAAYSPSITSLVDGQLFYVRASDANATTTPTFSPNGLTARTIVKDGGLALGVGDIVGAGHELILRYDLSNTRYEFLNPNISGFALLDSNNTFTANQTFTGLINYPLESTLTISSASVTPTGIVHLIENEGATSTDTLSTITAGSDGQILYLRPANATDVTTFDELGNILIREFSSFDMVGTDCVIMLVYSDDLSKWVVINPVVKDYIDTKSEAEGDSAKITAGTPQNSTSGTVITFGSIPAGVKRITLSFSGVSTNGTGNILIQLGDSGGIETTGYLGATGTFSSSFTQPVSYTNGINLPTAGVSINHGTFIFELLDESTFTWICTFNIGTSDTGRVFSGGYSKSLSSVLTQLHVTTTAGTDTFDAGKININYQL